MVAETLLDSMVSQALGHGLSIAVSAKAHILAILQSQNMKITLIPSRCFRFEWVLIRGYLGYRRYIFGIG
jgi:hypothetical protein